MREKTKILWLLISCVVVISMVVTFSLVGCKAAPEAVEVEKEEEAVAPAEEEEVVEEEVTISEITTIKWLNLWDSPKEDLFAEFYKENPNIEVISEYLPFGDLLQQLQVRLMAGSDDFDVFSADVPLVAGYALKGWLTPVDDIYTQEELDDFIESSLEAGKYNDQLVAAPVSTSTQLLYINLDLFEAAGVEPPGIDDRWTYEEIVEASQKTMSATPDTWGFTWGQTNRIYQLGVLPGSLGAPMIGPDGLTVEGVINSEEWIKAFTFYRDVFNTYNIGPKGEAIGASDLFMAGKIAMYVDGPWNISQFDDTDLQFEWSVSRHPYFEEGVPATPTGSWHIGVNVNSKNTEAAKKFVHWLTTGKGAELWWRYYGDMPAQKSVLALFATDSEFDNPPWSYWRTAADEANVNPIPRALTPGYMEYEQLLMNAADDIINGADVEETLDTAAVRIGAEMEKYK